VVGEIPRVPELFVYLSLKKEVRSGHVLYVFDVGHGWLGLLCGFDSLQNRNRFQFLKRNALRSARPSAAQEKSRSLFLFIFSLFSYFY
jgi:polyferredoxin